MANRVPKFIRYKNDFLTLLVMNKRIKGKLKCGGFLQNRRKGDK